MATSTTIRARPSTLDAAALRRVRRDLLRWYRTHARALPWRGARDAYRIWLSEIMLQQTRVETVIDYYHRFCERFPTVEDLAAAPLDAVLHTWSGLGYYTRARNLHRCAKAIVSRHNGAFPRSASELRQLPGIGRYTAAAIASIAFGDRAAALDGNIKRVLARLFAIEQPINDSTTTERLWAHAEQLLARNSPGDWNQALMELGATVCTPRRPRCLECPLRTVCAAATAGIQDRLPVRTSKRASPVIHYAALAIQRSGKLLFLQRPATGLLANLWQLPMIEVGGRNDDRSDGDRIIDLAGRTLGLTVVGPRQVGSVRHVFTHRVWEVTVYRARLARGRLRIDQPHQSSIWLPVAEADRLALASVDRKMLACLQMR